MAMLNGARIQSESKPDFRDWLDVSRDSAATSLPGSLDFDEARRFLTLLDGDAGRFLFGSHDDNKVRAKALIADAKASGRPKPNTFQSRCASLDDPDLRRWMPERQAAGWAITVSAQAMKASKRLASEVAYIRVIFAEMDIGEPLRPWPLEPSMVVETSPGRYHVYWLILSEGPITEQDFHGIMMCLCESYGADPDAKDLARTMRLPGTWNLKPERPPHLVRIVHQTGARYSGNELVVAFPPPPRAEPKSPSQRPKLNGHTPPGLERFGGENGPLKSDLAGCLWGLASRWDGPARRERRQRGWLVALGSVECDIGKVVGGRLRCEVEVVSREQGRHGRYDLRDGRCKWMAKARGLTFSPKL
jgi:RepB DNA-primase from phage plasmid